MCKKFIVVGLVLLLFGCSGRNNNNLFARVGDKLEVSTCTKCKGSPFYVNGRWIDNEKK